VGPAISAVTAAGKSAVAATGRSAVAAAGRSAVVAADRSAVAAAGRSAALLVPALDSSSPWMRRGGSRLPVPWTPAPRALESGGPWAGSRAARPTVSVVAVALTPTAIRRSC
jgi:hypothetical protein